MPADFRAARLHSLGALPRVEEIARPGRRPGQTLVSVAAAGVNPADLMMARGSYPGELPPLPFVVGLEGAGHVLESDAHPVGTPIWWQAPGSAATHAVVPDERTVRLPEEADLTVVAGLGIAGIAALVPLERLAGLRAGESVLVLGATGPVGRLGVQIARLLGAGRIVAAGRDSAAVGELRALADDTVVASGESWRRALAAAGGAEGFDVVLDPVWGAPAAAAAGAMAPGGRLITVGLKAGTEAAFGTDILGRGLTLIGFDSYRADAGVWTSAVRQLVDLLVAGKLELPVETMPLAVVQAWERQAQAPRRKLVLVPQK